MTSRIQGLYRNDRECASLVFLVSWRLALAAVGCSGSNRSKTVGTDLSFQDLSPLSRSFRYTPQETPSPEVLARGKQSLPGHSISLTL